MPPSKARKYNQIRNNVSGKLWGVRQPIQHTLSSINAVQIFPVFFYYCAPILSSQRKYITESYKNCGIYIKHSDNLSAHVLVVVFLNRKLVWKGRKLRLFSQTLNLRTSCSIRSFVCQKPFYRNFTPPNSIKSTVIIFFKCRGKRVTLFEIASFLEWQAFTLFTMPRNLIKITCSFQNFFEVN